LASSAIKQTQSASHIQLLQLAFFLTSRLPTRLILKVEVEELCVSHMVEQEQKEPQSKVAQRRAQRASWALLQRVHPILDLACADVIEVQAIDAGAHIALLARQFPGLHFELAQEATRCQDCSRILWAPDGVSEAHTTRHFDTYDAVVVTHDPLAIVETLRTFTGFARIAGVRDLGNGLSLAIFGKGLKRDLFKARVRDPLAA
jgi:hypothetical protein